jgi:hypothetical protein
MMTSCISPLASEFQAAQSSLCSPVGTRYMQRIPPGPAPCGVLKDTSSNRHYRSPGHPCICPSDGYRINNDSEVGDWEKLWEPRAAGLFDALHY